MLESGSTHLENVTKGHVKPSVSPEMILTERLARIMVSSFLSIVSSEVSDGN